MLGPYRIRKPDDEVIRVSRGSREVTFDFYLEKLLKLIPGEVIGLYVVGSGFIPKELPGVLAAWAVVCLLGVIALRTYATTERIENKPPQWGPVLISSVAFVIWVYTLGGPFLAFGVFVPWLSSLIVLVWTFFLPIFYNVPES